MSELIDPGLPEDNPRQQYHYNLVNNKSITWFTDQVGLRGLLTYLFRVLIIDFPDECMFDEVGNAQTKDERFRLIALAGPKGSVVTVYAFGDAAVAQVNQVIGDEWDARMDQLSRGEYTRGEVGGWRADIDHGQLADHFFTGNPEVWDYINGAEIVSVFDAWMFDEGDLQGSGSATT
jgi:hypothetical protein